MFKRGPRFTIKPTYPTLKLMPRRTMGLTKTRFKKMPLSRGLTYTPFKAPRSIQGSKLKIFGKLGRMGQSSFLNMSKRRGSKTARINSLERKITGYKISRFRLTNDCSDNPVNHMIGAGPKLITVTLLYPVGTPASTATGNYPGQVSELRILMFVPNWPGSKLTSFTDEINTFTQGPEAGVIFTRAFGLEFPNQSQIFANLPYNSAGVANVRTFNNVTNTILTSTQLINHNHIKVFSAKISYSFRNLSPFHKYDVHIFDVIMRTQEYFDFDGTCKTMSQPAQYLEEIMCSGTLLTDDAQAVIRNRYSMQIVAGIRKGRLPNKIFKVLSHKKIKLGRAKPITVVTNASDEGTVYIANSIQDNPMPSDRKWSKKYGQKIWYKGPCDTETSFAGDDLITDHPQKTVHTMVLTLISENDMVVALGSNLGQTSNANVAYEINKVITWKIKAL